MVAPLALAVSLLISASAGPHPVSPNPVRVPPPGERACARPQPPGGVFPTAQTAPLDRVAATVDGVAIFAGEVDHRVKQVLGNRAVDDAVRRRLQAEALEHLIKQQSILALLQRRGEACTEQDLNLAMSRLKDQLSRQEQTLEAHYREQGLCMAAVQRALRWQLSWARYLDKTITDESLQRYFTEHRAEFDGTRVRVAQILLTWPDDPAARADVEPRARAIRDAIVAGKYSFAAAARQYSASPSARDGGALEWISRHAPMPEFFSEAAFQLAAGEISPPVTSPLGVHLIQCLEIEPGRKTWEDVRETLAAAMREHLFEWTATHLDPRPVVHYTGARPHFQPGTRNLAPPTPDDDDDDDDATTHGERTGK